MKFQKYKTVARLSFSGYDDLNYENDTSVKKVDLPYSTEDRCWSKTFKFKIEGVQDIQLSKHSKLILESCFIPNIFRVTTDGNFYSIARGPFQLRCKNITDSYCYDSTFGNNGQPLLYTSSFNPCKHIVTNSWRTEPARDYADAIIPNTMDTEIVQDTPDQDPYGCDFLNPDSNTLYNFNITQNFFNSPFFEFTLMYIMNDANVPIPGNYSFTPFQLSLIIQDVDELDLLSNDTNEVDWKNWKPHLPPKRNL